MKKLISLKIVVLLVLAPCTLNLHGMMRMGRGIGNFMARPQQPRLGFFAWLAGVTCTSLGLLTHAYANELPIKEHIIQKTSLTKIFQQDPVTTSVKIAITKDDGTEVGYAEVQKCYLTLLEVREGHRRKGYGKELFNSAASYTKTQGCKTMHWIARAYENGPGSLSQNDLEDFYKRRGGTQEDINYFTLDLAKHDKNLARSTKNNTQPAAA